MTDPSADSPYVHHMNERFGPLELIDVHQLANSCTDDWYSQTLCAVNDSVVRLGVIQGEYHWHRHESDDELFFVLQGRLLIDLSDQSVELRPGQGFLVPKGIKHRTRAPERTIILMIETRDIVPTGS